MAVDISAVKPATQPGNPSWATNGGTRVAPTLGQKQSGWADSQRPPFNVMNWLEGFLADWSKYHEDATDQLDANKLSLHGTQSMAGDLKPDNTLTRTLGSVTKFWSEAYIDTLILSGEIDASGVAFIDFTGAGMVLHDVQMSERITFLNTADLKTTSRAKTLNTRNLIKAAGKVTCVSGVYTLVDGFNMSLGSPPVQVVNGGKKDVKLTFANAFANTDYIVVITPENGVGQSNFTVLSTLSTSKTTTTVDVQAATATAAGHVDIDTLVVTFNFIVLGVQ